MTLVYSLSVWGNMRKRKWKRRRLSWNKKPHGSALRRLRQRKRQAVQQFSSLDPDPCPVNLKPCSKISMFGRVFSNRWISQISRCSWNIVQDWVVYTRYIKVGKLTNDMIWEASWVRHSSVVLLIPSLGFFRLMLRSELIVVSLSLGRSWLWFNCFHLLVLQSSHAWVSVSGDKIGGSWWIEP